METFGTSLSILVCEDDAISLEMLRSTISVMYPESTVHSATDGKAGLKCFQENLPDIVITDIQMPATDGIEMSRRIQSIKPEVKTIVITAYGNKTVQELVRETRIRIDHCFFKPLMYKDLFAAINGCVADTTKTRQK